MVGDSEGATSFLFSYILLKERTTKNKHNQKITKKKEKMRKIPFSIIAENWKTLIF